MLGILFPRLSESNNSQVFLRWHWPLDPPNGTNLEQTTFVGLHLALLGLFWISNNIFIIIDSGVHPSLHSNCHHQITYCKFNLIINYPPPYKGQVWDYKKANTTLIKKALSQVNWYFLFDKKDVNDQVKILNDTITNVFLILYQIKYCWWQGPSIDERTD